MARYASAWPPEPTLESRTGVYSSIRLAVLPTPITIASGKVWQALEGQSASFIQARVASLSEVRPHVDRLARRRVVVRPARPRLISEQRLPFDRRRQPVDGERRRVVRALGHGAARRPVEISARATHENRGGGVVHANRRGAHA